MKPFILSNPPHIFSSISILFYNFCLVSMLILLLLLTSPCEKFLKWKRPELWLSGVIFPQSGNWGGILSVHSSADSASVGHCASSVAVWPPALWVADRLSPLIWLAWAIPCSESVPPRPTDKIWKETLPKSMWKVMMEGDLRETRRVPYATATWTNYTQALHITMQTAMMLCAPMPKLYLKWLLHRK